MRRMAISRLQVIAAAVLFSIGGAAIKASSLGPWQVASFRCGIAAVTLWLLLPAGRRGWSWRTWLVGAAQAGTLVSYVVANKLTTAAKSVFLLATAPLYALVLGRVLLRETPRPRDLGFMGVLAVGMALFFVGVGEGSSTAPAPGLGNLVAALGGLFWGLTIVGLRWAARHESGGDLAAQAVICGNLQGFLVCLPLALPVVAFEARDVWILLLLGVFQIAVAYVALIRGLDAVPAFEASLLLLLEPVLNPMFAWLAHGERPGGWPLVGGGLILAATALRSWLHSRSAAAPARPESPVRPTGPGSRRSGS